MVFHVHNGAKNASVLSQQTMQYQGHLADNKKTMFSQNVHLSLSVCNLM